MKLSEEEIERLTADPTTTYLPMPTIEELDHALTLIKKRYPYEAWHIRRQLKWLVKIMNKHYGIGWTTPWDKRR